LIGLLTFTAQRTKPHAFGLTPLHGDLDSNLCRLDG
jgi:hypothetical protein